MKAKAHELRTLSKDELNEKLAEFKQELLTLRVQSVSGSNNQKISKTRGVRKNIARVLTVITQKQRDTLREVYKGKKYVPLDLRVKKTRAIRRRLTAAELKLKTPRQHKKDLHFPLRKYAVKA